jgi:hypothetical protein
MPVAYERLGSKSGTADEHMVDTYIVHCSPSGPTVLVEMDMYHDHRESAPVGPFMVLADLPAKLATGCPPEISSNPDSNAHYVFSAFEVERPVQLVTDEQPIYPVGFDGRAWVSAIVDTARVPEPASIQIRYAEPSKVRPHVPAALAAIRFQPALHHAGCVVRQRIEGPVEFR